MIFEEINKRYEGQFDPSHPDYAEAREWYDIMMAEADGRTDKLTDHPEHHRTGGSQD